MIDGHEPRRIVTNAPLIAGVLGIAGLVAMGIFGVALAPHDPNAGVAIVWRGTPSGTLLPLSPPTLPDAQYWLGTDALGRDQWSRILAGAWLTLAVVLASTFVRLVIGVAMGIVTGWYGGGVARSVRVGSRGTAALPQLLLAILLVLVTRPLGAIGFILSLAVVGWPEVAEFVSAEARRAKAAPFVQAARSIGAREHHVITAHLLRSMSPQLLTLGALETGAVLLLLAELGIVGLFVAGATFLVGEFGPMSPLSGRVPEWGQMLGAIQFYAVTEQLSTLLPAVFIVLAASAFTLLADGLRLASDPHSPQRLQPSSFGVIAKVLTAALCFSAVGFIGANVRSGAMTMDEGRALSATTAQATWPGSVLVAGVARYVSPTQGFARPARLTFYYRDQNNDILRISYLNAERLATEVRPHETEDELEFTELRELPAGLASYEGPVTVANDRGGGELRANLGASLVRVIITMPNDRSGPVYAVTLGRPDLLTLYRFCCFDGRTGEVVPGAAWSRV
jgi:peptide/nickel transport system permease protein